MRALYAKKIKTFTLYRLLDTQNVLGTVDVEQPITFRKLTAACEEAFGSEDLYYSKTEKLTIKNFQTTRVVVYISLENAKPPKVKEKISTTDVESDLKLMSLSNSSVSEKSPVKDLVMEIENKNKKEREPKMLFKKEIEKEKAEKKEDVEEKKEKEKYIEDEKEEEKVLCLKAEGTLAEVFKHSVSKAIERVSKTEYYYGHRGIKDFLSNIEEGDVTEEQLKLLGLKIVSTNNNNIRHAFSHQIFGDFGKLDEYDEGELYLIDIMIIKYNVKLAVI